MCDNPTKKGRKRVLSDEERKERKKENDSRRIIFSTPMGFKDEFLQFVNGRDISTVLYDIVRKNPDFKEFKLILAAK